MNTVFTFFKESWAELKQVSWLTTPQMIASTWMVIILVIIMAIYVGLIDFVLSFVFRVVL